MIAQEGASEASAARADAANAKRAADEAAAIEKSLIYTLRTAHDNGTNESDVVKLLKPMFGASDWWVESAFVINPETNRRNKVHPAAEIVVPLCFATSAIWRGAESWDGVQRTKQILPLLRYTALADDCGHSEWHGIVLEVNDPWWRKHFPPNSALCGCAADSLSRSDLEEEGNRISGVPSTQCTVDPLFSGLPSEEMAVRVVRAWLANPRVFTVPEDP
ncbi:MAG TPA: hypothetical protein VMV27_01985 [Candidatus Binataceae bacterium]|nr:hypothetical protein [Candidatus Binataceae bacterium]